MNTNIFVKVLLVILGAIGAIGMAVIFFPRGEFTGRLFSMTMVSGNAIGLIVLAKNQLQNERMRDGAILAICVTLVAYAVYLIGIWSSLWGLGDGWNWTSTARVIFGYGMTSVLAVVMCRYESGRWSGVCGVVCSVLALVMFVLGIWYEEISTFTDQQFELTGKSFGLFGVLAAISMYGIATTNGVLWWVTRVGVVISAVGLGISIADIWLWIHVDLVYASQLLIISAALAHANLVIRLRLKSLARVALVGTVGCAAITAGCLIVFMESAGGFDITNIPTTNPFIRTGALFGVLTACGTALLVVSHRRSFNVRVPFKRADYALMHVRCPHCQTEQAAPVDVSGCLRCGMQIGISMRVPHCAGCGYETLGVQGGACPECGEKLPPRGVRLEGVSVELGKVGVKTAEVI